MLGSFLVYNHCVFTGLIQEVGTVTSRLPGALAITCAKLRPELALGDSVAVNGACLTVVKLSRDSFEADLLDATSNNTNLGGLAIGGKVNLEPALKVGDSLGGHFVQGHIDGVAACLGVKRQSSGMAELQFELPAWLAPMIVERGSVALNGVSLTVQRIEKASFRVEIIPTTMAETNLSGLKPGSNVNVEADLIVKTVLKAVAGMTKGSSLSYEKLKELGYG